MAFVAVTTPIVLPWPLQSSLESMARVLLEPGDRSHIDFSRPVGEAALLSPESVSWRVFKNAPQANLPIRSHSVQVVNLTTTLLHPPEELRRRDAA